MTALLNTDGTTITVLVANPSNHGLSVDNNTIGSDNGGTYAHLDENFRPTMFALSSAGDGSFVSLYADSDGKLLIDEN